MLTATTVAARQIEFADRPTPDPGPRQALLEVHSVTLCGTDLHIWDDHYASDLPLVQGHEFSARILSLPRSPASDSPAVDALGRPLALGDQVAVSPMITCDRCWACRHDRSNACKSISVLGCYQDGALTEHIAVDTKRLYKLPPGLDIGLAPLAEPISIAMQAVNRARPDPEDTAVVLGCGPIGLLATRILTDRGVQVIAADTQSERVERARTFGAAHGLVVRVGTDFPAPEQAHDLIAWTGDDGPSLVIEATGVPASLANALGIVCAGGRVVCVGISDQEMALSMRVLPVKELDLLGSRNSRNLIGESLNFITEHTALVSSLITHRFPLEHLDLAFRTMSDLAQGVGKIAIDIADR